MIGSEIRSCEIDVFAKISFYGKMSTRKMAARIEWDSYHGKP